MKRYGKQLTAALLALCITLGLAGIFGEVNLPQLPLAAAVPLFVLVVVAATYGSFRLSVHFYRKRQNGAYN